MSTLSCCNSKPLGIYRGIDAQSSIEITILRKFLRLIRFKEYWDSCKNQIAYCLLECLLYPISHSVSKGPSEQWLIPPPAARWSWMSVNSGEEGNTKCVVRASSA